MNENLRSCEAHSRKLRASWPQVERSSKSWVYFLTGKGVRTSGFGMTANACWTSCPSDPRVRCLWLQEVLQMGQAATEHQRLQKHGTPPLTAGGIQQRVVLIGIALRKVRSRWICSSLHSQQWWRQAPRPQQRLRYQARLSTA